MSPVTVGTRDGVAQLVSNLVVSSAGAWARVHHCVGAACADHVDSSACFGGVGEQLDISKNAVGAGGMQSLASVLAASDCKLRTLVEARPFCGIPVEFNSIDN